MSGVGATKPANFYLAPTRAWELFSGSIAAFVVQKKGVQKNNLLLLLAWQQLSFLSFITTKQHHFQVYSLFKCLVLYCWFYMQIKKLLLLSCSALEVCWYRVTRIIQPIFGINRYYFARIESVNEILISNIYFVNQLSSFGIFELEIY